MMRRSLATWVLLALLFVFAVGTVVYWVLYFFVGGVQSSSALWYTRFENAFPVADAWAVVACLLAATFVLRSDTARAPFFLGAAGASVLYLAFMDITFDLENSIYSSLATNGAVVVELGINIFTLVTGLFALGYGWSLLRSSGKVP
jgi:hypothetical protein